MQRRLEKGKEGLVLFKQLILKPKSRVMGDAGTLGHLEKWLSVPTTASREKNGHISLIGEVYARMGAFYFSRYPLFRNILLSTILVLSMAN